MVNPEDIPKSMNFDFLVVLLGLGFIFLPFYFELLKTQAIVSMVLIWVGGLILGDGLGRMQYAYKMEVDIKELEYANTKCRLLTELIKKGIITNKDKDKFDKNLKKRLKKLNEN